MITRIKQIIKGYALWIWYYISKSYREKVNEEAKRRIKICEECEHFWKMTRSCELCGCFMNVKTKMPVEYDEYGENINGCWDNKW